MLRYVLNADKEIIERTFAVQSNSDSMYTTAFNVFPNSLMPVVLNTNLRIIKKGIWGISEKKGVTTSAIDKDAILNNTKLASIQFAVLTMPANVLLKPLEETMPCVLEPADFNAWLNGDIKNIIASKFKDTALIPDLAVYRVPDLVNDPSQNSKELIQPIPKLREDD